MGIAHRETDIICDGQRKFAAALEAYDATSDERRNETRA